MPISFGTFDPARPIDRRKSLSRHVGARVFLFDHPLLRRYLRENYLTVLSIFAIPDESPERFAYRGTEANARRMHRVARYLLRENTRNFRGSSRAEFFSPAVSRARSPVFRGGEKYTRSSRGRRRGLARATRYSSGAMHCRAGAIRASQSKVVTDAAGFRCAPWRGRALSLAAVAHANRSPRRSPRRGGGRWPPSFLRARPASSRADLGSFFRSAFGPSLIPSPPIPTRPRFCRRFREATRRREPRANEPTRSSAPAERGRRVEKEPR